MSNKKTVKNNYRLGYNDYGTADEFIRKLSDTALDSLNNMLMNDGDMFISDYQKLITAYHLLQHRGE